MIFERPLKRRFTATVSSQSRDLSSTPTLIASRFCVLG